MEYYVLPAALLQAASLCVLGASLCALSVLQLLLLELQFCCQKSPCLKAVSLCPQDVLACH